MLSVLARVGKAAPAPKFSLKKPHSKALEMSAKVENSTARCFCPFCMSRQSVAGEKGRPKLSISGRQLTRLSALEMNQRSNGGNTFRKFSSNGEQCRWVGRTGRAGACGSWTPCLGRSRVKTALLTGLTSGTDPDGKLSGRSRPMVVGYGCSLCV